VGSSEVGSQLYLRQKRKKDNVFFGPHALQNSVQDDYPAPTALPAIDFAPTSNHISSKLLCDDLTGHRTGNYGAAFMQLLGYVFELAKYNQQDSLSR
jgi:hypothetical protein